MDLFSRFRRFRTGIMIAIGLVVIENLAWILEPTVFGNVIDASIDKASSLRDAAFLLPLPIWVGVFPLNSVVGALRRSVDGRINLRMFTDIATDVARIAARRDHSVPRTAARAGLSREYIAFFQHRFPEILEQTIAIGVPL